MTTRMVCIGPNGVRVIGLLALIASIHLLPLWEFHSAKPLIVISYLGLVVVNVVVSVMFVLLNDDLIVRFCRTPAFSPYVLYVWIALTGKWWSDRMDIHNDWPLALAIPPLLAMVMGVLLIAQMSRLCCGSQDSMGNRND